MSTQSFSLALTGARVGIPYPIAALEVIKAELGVAGSRALLLGATTFDSSEARRCGILDEEVTHSRVLARAAEVAKDRASLRAGNYGDLKHQLRAASIVHIRESLDTDPALEGWIVDGNQNR